MTRWCWTRRNVPAMQPVWWVVKAAAVALLSPVTLPRRCSVVPSREARSQGCAWSAGGAVVDERDSSWIDRAERAGAGAWSCPVQGRARSPRQFDRHSLWARTGTELLPRRGEGCGLYVAVASPGPDALTVELIGMTGDPVMYGAVREHYGYPEDQFPEYATTLDHVVGRRGRAGRHW